MNNYVDDYVKVVGLLADAYDDDNDGTEVVSLLAMMELYHWL